MGRGRKGTTALERHRNINRRLTEICDPTRMSKIARNPLYRRHRFPLSLRMVEDMLAARGVIVSHQTVRAWAEKFGRHFANKIKRRSAGRLGDKWHLGCKAAGMPRRQSG